MIKEIKTMNRMPKFSIRFEVCIALIVAGFLIIGGLTMQKYQGQLAEINESQYEN